jgi:two-component system nitrate/nitrite response regulator NarL
MFIKGLKMILSTYDNMRIIGLANNGIEVLEFLEKEEVDVIMMDINMPEMNGYEATLEATKKYPDLKVIAFSMLVSASSVMNMLEAGAKGYLAKNADENELIAAINAVYECDFYVTKEYSDVLLNYKKGRNKLDVKKTEARLLSKREIEILQMIINGDTNLDIAEKLFLSNRTVDTHRKNILAKLNQKNTASLVNYAFENKAFLGLV